MHATVYMQFSLSTLRVLGIELRFSALAARAFTHYIATPFKLTLMSSV